MNDYGRRGNASETLSERLTNLSASKSYMFLGRGNASETVSANTNKSKIGGKSTAAANLILMRDDFNFFELIFHSQGNEGDHDDGNTEKKRTIRDPSDYSIVYHNWTLRQLYRHVVSSIKIHPSTTTTAASASTKAFSSPPSNTNQHPNRNRSSSTGSAARSRHHRRHSSISNNNTNYHNQPKLLGSNLHPRDMRRLVTPFSASNEPELIVRRHVMVFNFDPLRAIITQDRLLVLVPNGGDSILLNLEERIVGSGLEYDGYNEETEHAGCDDIEEEGSSLIYEQSLHLNDLEHGTHEDEDEVEWDEMMMMEMEGQRQDLTFELLCVNACLSIVFEMLADDTKELQDKGLQCIQDRVIGNRKGRDRGNKKPQQRQLRPEDALAVIRNLKLSVKVMQARVKGLVHSINRILNEDEDMALMNLSRLVTHPENFVQPISPEMLEIESDEPELVLESNLHDALTLSNALDLIQGQVDAARHV
jgi:magnesium transporter